MSGRIKSQTNKLKESLPLSCGCAFEINPKTLFTHQSRENTLIRPFSPMLSPANVNMMNLTNPLRKSNSNEDNPSTYLFTVAIKNRVADLSPLCDKHVFRLNGETKLALIKSNVPLNYTLILFKSVSTPLLALSSIASMEVEHRVNDEVGQCKCGFFHEVEH